MKNHGMMMKGRIFLCTVFMAWAAVMNGGHAAEENPVKVGVGHVGWEPHLMWHCSGEEDLGDFKETEPELGISLMLSAREPLCFPKYAHGGKQVLELIDSSGRKLAPVTFDLEQLFQRQEQGVTYANVAGTLKEAPGPDISWLRLRGELTMPLARFQQSPVYELAFQSGAQMDILLHNDSAEEEAGNGDIVVGEDGSVGKLSLGECGIFEKEGKKMARVEIVLERESHFDLTDFQILNDRNGVLESTCLSRIASGEGFSFSPFCYVKSLLELEAPEDLRKLRIRLLYRVRQKAVTVPVDIKFGMRGEIREEPEKGKGALLR